MEENKDNTKIREMGGKDKKEPEREMASNGLLLTDLLKKARSLDESGRHEDAIEVYTQVIKVDPKCFDAFYSRGNIYLTMGIYHKAVKDFDRAIKLRPKNAEVHYQRGDISQGC